MAASLLNFAFHFFCGLGKPENKFSDRAYAENRYSVATKFASPPPPPPPESNGSPLTSITEISLIVT